MSEHHSRTTVWHRFAAAILLGLIAVVLIGSCQRAFGATWPATVCDADHTFYDKLDGTELEQALNPDGSYTTGPFDFTCVIIKESTTIHTYIWDGTWPLGSTTFGPYTHDISAIVLYKGGPSTQPTTTTTEAPPSTTTPATTTTSTTTTPSTSNPTSTSSTSPTSTLAPTTTAPDPTSTSSLTTSLPPTTGPPSTPPSTTTPPSVTSTPTTTTLFVPPPDETLPATGVTQLNTWLAGTGAILILFGGAVSALAARRR